MSDSGSINGDDGGSLFSRSPSVAEASGQERWRASEPPEEIFGDGEWKFQIIGEEIDHQGNIQYEVEWEDWERDDKSNVTWETKDTISDIKWKPVQQKIRHDMALRSLSMDVITTTDIHNTETYLRKQAFKEKLKKYKSQRATNSFQEMEQLMQKHQDYLNPNADSRTQMSQSRSQGSSSSPFPLRTNQRASTRQQTENSLAGSSRSTPSRASSRFSSVSVSIPPHPGYPLFPSFPSDPSSTTKLPVNSSNSSTSKSSQMPYRTTISSNLPQASVPSSKGKEKEIYHLAHIKHEDLEPPLDRLSSPATVDSQVTKRDKRVSRDSDSEESLSTLVSTRTPRKRVRRVVNSGSEDDGRPFSPSLSDFHASSQPNSSGILPTGRGHLDRRNKLQRDWTEHTLNADAAPISFLNDIDDEELPDIDSSFCYLESTYEYSPDVEKPPDEFLIFCSCRRCDKATLCECQDPSELVDEGGSRIFAYQSGLFKFNVPRGTEVIECNKFCECSKDPRNCPNRVSQRPRKHPIEVFKTQKCGWGVRSTQPVKRGQVLGIYTGLVMTRENANALPEHLARYRFDLDGDELGDQEGQVELNHPRYSVDSRLHGNWTRFINHSCSPNLQIYLVVRDTPAGVGLPYIVFVANQNIPVHKEFTFDYNPSKPMPSSQDSEGDRERCHCGSDNCRGFY